jgi:hypothetical protein
MMKNIKEEIKQSPDLTIASTFVPAIVKQHKE